MMASPAVAEELHNLYSMAHFVLRIHLQRVIGSKGILNHYLFPYHFLPLTPTPN